MILIRYKSTVARSIPIDTETTCLGQERFMWSFAATCDVSNPCMQLAVFLVSKANMQIISAFCGHLE